MIYGQELPNYPLADFSVNLYQHAGMSNESVCISPLSVSLALSMIFFGSAGSTRTQIRDALFGTSVTDQQAMKFMANVIKTVNSTDKTFQLYVVNRLYVNNKYRLSDVYRKDVMQKLNSDIVAADFSNPRRAAFEINHWVATESHYKIKDFMSASSLNEATSLVIVNAVYFNSHWLKEFSARDTSKQTFYCSPGHSSVVDMMSQEKEFLYGESSDCQVLGLRYTGPFMSMFVLLPKERYGLRRFEEQLTARKFVELLSATRRQKVKFPKFKLQSKLNLQSVLKGTGITEMFRATADLYRMTGKRELYVSSGIHQSFMQVDEKGTEAVAATGIEIMPLSADLGHRVASFIADHPFMFTIVDTNHKNILFLGRFSGAAPR